MKYISTRGASAPLTFSQALTQGLASDGGLYVPERFPVLNLADFKSSMSLAEWGEKILRPFFDEDPLQEKLSEICQAALNFPIPLRFRHSQSAVLELFHGPTAAFKDVGARFLAECLSHSPVSEKTRTVLVATSGDTGGAVAGAFFGKPGIEVFVLFPKGKISARQEKQIACWGGNVKAFAVHGTFDDCQKIVKDALSDSPWRQQRTFISANSISIGRLLPQMIYYAKSSWDYREARGTTPGLVIPTGNLGNAVAALWTKQLGFPIGNVILATNANHSISDFFTSGVWKPNPTMATLANAMDVGNPSNVERLRYLYPQIETLRKNVSVLSVSDEQIRAAILREFRTHREVFCPHTATALVAQPKSGDWILVATAHAAKFETIVEPLIGEKIPIPPALATLLNRPSRYLEMEPSLEAFKRLIQAH